jgi:hypothetical protein
MRKIRRLPAINHKEQSMLPLPQNGTFAAFALWSGLLPYPFFKRARPIVRIN